MSDITCCSHTLARNSMPFIEPVLRNVEPFMNRMLITVSEKSNDGTIDFLRKFEHEFPKKVRLGFENVQSPGMLTQERQKQVEMTHEDWILFLDDDDIWTEKSLKEMMHRLEAPVNCYATSPFQVIDEKTYDSHWLNKKFFSKWFKNKNIVYKYPWPRDLIYQDGKPLYWKQNPDVVLLKGMYYHLSYIKDYSFRNNEEWGKTFKEQIKSLAPYPDEIKKDVWEIFNWKSTH